MAIIVCPVMVFAIHAMGQQAKNALDVLKINIRKKMMAMNNVKIVLLKNILKMMQHKNVLYVTHLAKHVRTMNKQPALIVLIFQLSIIFNLIKLVQNIRK